MTSQTNLTVGRIKNASADSSTSKICGGIDFQSENCLNQHCMLMNQKCNEPNLMPNDAKYMVT